MLCSGGQAMWCCCSIPMVAQATMDTFSTPRRSDWWCGTAARVPLAMQTPGSSQHTAHTRRPRARHVRLNHKPRLHRIWPNQRGDRRVPVRLQAAHDSRRHSQQDSGATGAQRSSGCCNMGAAADRRRSRVRRGHGGDQGTQGRTAYICNCMV